MIIESLCADDTFAFGKKLGEAAEPGTVYTLVGDLGVGKTVLTQGLAEGLGITEAVNSPTFTILQVYEEGRLPLYHFDVYRIGDVEEMDEIGYEDYFYGDGVCLIEWANLIEEILPEKYTEIRIEKDLEKGFDYRKITDGGGSMKVLGLDSSGLVAGVALIQDDVLIAEYTTDYKKTHSQTLLPMLDELRRMVDLDLKSIDLIAVAAGPGSFTGLRIGSATAKGLGLALDIPLAAVPTVDALAYNLYGCEQLICPMMDARRGQVYTGIYTFVNGEMQVIQEQCAISVEELAGRLKEECEKYGKKVVLLGDGVPVYREKVQEILQEQCEFAPASCNRQRAACVAVLGQSLAAAGKTVSSDDFAPEYLRMSQAERERMEADEAHRELMKAGITK